MLCGGLEPRYDKQYGVGLVGRLSQSRVTVRGTLKTLFVEILACGTFYMSSLSPSFVGHVQLQGWRNQATCMHHTPLICTRW